MTEIHAGEKPTMKPTDFFSCVALTLTIFVGYECLYAEPPTNGLQRIDALMERGIEEKYFPGAVVIVGNSDGIHFEKAYGRQRYDADAPVVTMETLYDLASLTKVIATTSAVLILADRGELELDQTVESILPAFASEGKDSVTIRDLLAHRSGLKPYESVDMVEKGRQSSRTNAEALIDHYCLLPTSYAPGSKVVYSCLNFQTLAAIAESVSGEPLEDFLRRELFTPLQMNQTVYTVSEAAIPLIAPAYRDGGAIVHDPLARFHGIDGSMPGNAGLFSNAPDLALFCRFLLGNSSESDPQIFSKAILREAFRNQSPPEESDKRGLGWDLFDNPPYVGLQHDSDGRRIVGHTGFTGTMIWMDEVSGAYFVFLTNRTFPTDDTSIDSNRGIHEFRQSLASIVLKEFPSAPRNLPR